MTVKAQMKEVMAFIEQTLTDGANRDHWNVCQMTAQEYDLWEDDKFPLWLSFVVQGQMRELGIDR